MTKIIDGVKLDYDDVLIMPKRSKAASRSKVKLERDFSFYHSDQKWTGIPIIVANMDTTGSMAMAQALAPLGLSVALHKHYSAEKLIEFYDYAGDDVTSKVFYSLGIHEEDLNKFKKVWTVQGGNVFKNRVRNICIDVANGYTDDFADYCKRIRQMCPNAVIMAGNVCTPEMVQELILHGEVDIVKIGIGPGSVCTTRLVAGVGYPQLSAILECSNVAHGLTNGDKKLGLVCADGGIVNIADFAKAFGANADFVMAGGMFAGCDECEGEWDTVGGKRYVGLGEIAGLNHRKQVFGKSSFKEGELGSQDSVTGTEYIITFDESNADKWIEQPNKAALKFYGMSSSTAQEKYCGGKPSYRASEGRTVTIPYKGFAADIANEILGGLRSTCAYIGTDSIKYMGRCTTFVRVSNKQTHNTVYAYDSTKGI